VQVIRKQFVYLGVREHPTVDGDQHFPFRTNGGASNPLASALKWAFADFDDLSVSADKETLTPEDFSRVMDLMKLRPMQFCLFLKALVGVEEI